MFEFIKKLFGSRETSESLKSIIDGGALLVDVRNPHELNGGQVDNAMNIPLNQVGNQINKFKNQNQIILFCETGIRAARARAILQSHGITNVTNGGSWKNVDKAVKAI